MSLAFVGVEPVDSAVLTADKPFNSGADPGTLYFVGAEPVDKSKLLTIPTTLTADSNLNFVGVEPVDESKLDTGWNT